MSRSTSRLAALLIATVLAGTVPAPAQPTAPIPVWIDVDPSAAGGYGLVINDDGLALAQAFHSPELAVRGVSATFGNAAIDETLRIARDVVARFGPAGMVVHRGAAGGDELGRETAASRWLAGPASGWLEWWERRFGVEGFYPFDTLAVAYLTSPAWLTCDDLPAAIRTAPDDVKVPSMGAAAPDKPYLVVAEKFAPARRVRYCHDVAPAFKADLMARLIRSR
tara:strand:+ start:6560 stop:7228 length:669 start_codon:yes stop_codon:yes gene_type:complete